MKIPDKHLKFPLSHHYKLCFLKNIIHNPNIEVGDYTYYDDFESVANFEKNVKYHFDFIGDKLIIGKFCMIASDVSFIMNGANHFKDALSTYPFSIFGADWASALDGRTYPVKGDTHVGNDVWFGRNVTVMPGITIGDGAIIATNTTITKDVPPYAVVGGNPARIIKMRFPEETIAALLTLQWWDWDIETITRNVQALTGTDIEALQKAAPRK